VRLHQVIEPLVDWLFDNSTFLVWEEDDAIATGRSVHFSSTLFTKDAASDVRCFSIAAERRCKRASDSAQLGYQRTISDNNRRQIPESNESLVSIWR
jgi:hypothetical protein